MEDNKKHIQFVDYFRGIAILAVFLFHCLGAAYGHYSLLWRGHWFADFSTTRSFLILMPVTFGWAGVPIFFVISGFCIHLSYLKGVPNDWRGFFARRFFRIYPPYLLALVFFAAVFPTTRLLFHSLPDYAQFGSHVLLMHNLGQRSYSGINGAFWSIAVEAQLYLLYPGLLALVRKIGWQRSLIALCILEVLMRVVSGVFEAVNEVGAPHWFRGLPFCYWYSWAIGAALADAYITKRPLPFISQSSAVWCVLAVGSSFIRPLEPLSFLFFALLTATAIARLLAAKKYSANAEHFPGLAVHLRNLGIYSYSFYLLHFPFVIAFPVLLRKLHAWPYWPPLGFVLCVGTYPFIYLLSCFYYRYCEQGSIAIGKSVLPGSPVIKGPVPDGH